jgi:hypothetical protein
MPTVFRYGKYRFFFFSNEGTEPCHVHIECGDGYAKFWVVPEVRLAFAQKLNARDLNVIVKLVRKNRKLILEAWNEFFSNKI